MAARVERLQELDPAAAEDEHLERILDRHAALCVAAVRQAEAEAAGDELAAARIRRDLAVRGGETERTQLEALIARLAACVEDPGELPDEDEVRAYVHSLDRAPAAATARPIRRAH